MVDRVGGKLLMSNPQRHPGAPCTEANGGDGGRGRDVEVVVEVGSGVEVANGK